jgi:hypothetical protein
MALRDPDWRLFVLFALFASAGDAQWLDFREPGVPRTPDGRADMTAPTPKAPDDHPDLSGVWMHETTTVAEMKRLYGRGIEEAIKVDAPGMEIGTQHKYGLNILLDFRTEDSLIRPEAVEQMRGNQALMTTG